MSLETVHSQRGVHNIQDEIVFPKLPGFVLHDSCEVEAGGVTEKDLIEGFVKEHSTSVKNKNNILHAIW
jgi:hypothetical protein